MVFSTLNIIVKLNSQMKPSQHLRSALDSYFFNSETETITIVTFSASERSKLSVTENTWSSLRHSCTTRMER